MDVAAAVRADKRVNRAVVHNLMKSRAPLGH